MNITYLFGAGASYNALPVVDQIPIALEGFANDFDLGEPYMDIVPFTFNENLNMAHAFLASIEGRPKQEKYFKIIKKFHQDILWLYSESKNHSSIDTFAKKLHLQESHADLKRLKIILSCFFLYLQTKKFDKRYDSFFASILEHISVLPKEIRILSWNYDSQLEIAFQRFSNFSIQSSKQKLNLKSKGINDDIDINIDEFSAFKINGTTSLNRKENKSTEEFDIIEEFTLDKRALVSEFIRLYEDFFARKYKSSVSFAWEGFQKEKGFFKNLGEAVSKTEILIVIGYSFPFFNRKIDQFILESMPKLKKVYVQDPENADDIIEKMKGLVTWQKSRLGFKEPGNPNLGLANVTKSTIEFIPRTFVDQFFIPIEF